MATCGGRSPSSSTLSVTRTDCPGSARSASAGSSTPPGPTPCPPDRVRATAKKRAGGTAPNAGPDLSQAIADALPAVTVCDPACASGHFLAAAARRIAKRLAAVREHNPEPTTESLRIALREVVK